MKLSQYAKKVGVTYRTVFRWWQQGQIKGYQFPSGTIVVTEGEEISERYAGQIAIYARVSSHEHRANLERQAERLEDYCAAIGIEVVIVQESYTSKASFLDRDLIPTYDPERREKPRFSGKREHRGLYRASNGRRIHADINGSYNILRKAFPDSFGQGTEAPAVVPRQLAV